MELTEIRINLAGGNAGGRLKAFCSLTFDDTFVVRDVKLIDGHDGIFLAMPSRKLSDHCGRCGEKNHLRARFCNGCGRRLDERRGNANGNHFGSARQKLHTDIAHPINVSARQRIEREVLAEYYKELERSQQPGYVAPNLDVDYDDDYIHEPMPRSTAAVTSAMAPGGVQTALRRLQDEPVAAVYRQPAPPDFHHRSGHHPGGSSVI
jgi:stage V sporulation protein G